MSDNYVVDSSPMCPWGLHKNAELMSLCECVYVCLCVCVP